MIRFIIPHNRYILKTPKKYVVNRCKKTTNGNCAKNLFPNSKKKTSVNPGNLVPTMLYEESWNQISANER